MKTQRQKLGKLGEDLAVKYLQKNGYKILTRNYIAGRYGEIDIIAKNNGQLAFVEVKTKSDNQFGDPEQEFTYFKKKKLYRSIQNYLFKNSLQDKPWQLDLIAIEILNKNNNLRHYKNIS